MVLINSGAREDYETAHAFADKTTAVSAPRLTGAPAILRRITG